MSIVINQVAISSGLAAIFNPKLLLYPSSTLAELPRISAFIVAFDGSVNVACMKLLVHLGS